MASAPGINIALFTDLHEALRQVVADVRALGRLPKARRDEVLTAISSAYAILDQATGLVISRLGKVLERGDLGNRRGFVEELSALRSIADWYRIEREMALCSALRATHSELRRFFPGLLARKSVKDWDAVDAQMNAILQTEGELAEHISSTLEGLSRMATTARSSKAGFEEARLEVEKARDALRLERHKLLRDEIALVDLV